MGTTLPPTADFSMLPLEERLQQIEKEAADNLAGWQRARADYQNLKKEWAKKQTQFVTEAKISLLLDLLPIYDHLKQALSQPIEAVHLAEWRQGIAQIKLQWDSVLQRLGVEAVPTVQQKFNPEIHEAVEHQQEGDTVVREVQGGYRVNGQLLYPARVVVGTSPGHNIKPEHPPNTDPLSNTAM